MNDPGARSVDDPVDMTDPDREPVLDEDTREHAEEILDEADDAFVVVTRTTEDGTIQDAHAVQCLGPHHEDLERAVREQLANLRDDLNVDEEVDPADPEPVADGGIEREHGHLPVGREATKEELEREVADLRERVDDLEGRVDGLVEASHARGPAHVDAGPGGGDL